MLTELNTEGTNISEQAHGKKWPLRLAERYLRPILTALLFAQTLALPISSLADDENTDNQVSHEYLVDVIIHRDLPQQETEVWARDVIDNYINQAFEQADIRHRLRVDRVVTNYDEQGDCPLGGIKEASHCTYDDYSRIRVWLNKNNNDGEFDFVSEPGAIILSDAVAWPETAQIFMAVPVVKSVPFDPLWEAEDTRRAITHEFGHIFKMPDYYEECVFPSYNSVAPIGIRPYAQDIMGDCTNDYDHFSQTSKGFADRTLNLPPAGYETPSWEIQYTPRNTILRLVDDEGLSMVGVSIEVFPQKWESSRQIISPDATIRGITDDNGRFELGDQYRIFDTSGFIFTAGVAFLRITNGESIRFAAITRSYLNHLYFQGFGETALVSVPFSDLHTLEEVRNRYLSAPGVALEDY